ncbi:uncharacterized protein N0V89_008744 [Didymosphaeria variabile]|uniref:NmrA-like domain-containing protein n=1 Tax=Didymosphaeria variabile TaxID=1932322 RepID=A0A9W9C937_9PLEO|nr:uncharacterized protein N0V89_008744 [Didymosphaeria variabile]KAJ4350123.1 hypothetical protein N0V89_008744 [Didymosphaeria variabile]
MSKVLAVFGATGQQGSSVVNHVLQDPALAQQYTIRALTRDTGSEKSQQLRAKGVDIVTADVLERASLQDALRGVHTVFAMTTPLIGPDVPEGEAALNWEFENAKRIADVALAMGVKYLIFSTLPSVRDVSGGKYTAVTPFDAKAKAETYIRSLSPKMESAFFCPGNFMENFQAQFWIAPRKIDGIWTLARPALATSKIPLIAAVDDSGRFVGKILAHPEKYAGKRFCAAEGRYSWDDIAAALGKSAGQKVVYKQIGYEQWRGMFPFAGKLFEEAFRYAEEFGGYFGEEEESELSWAIGEIGERGDLLGFEQFLEKYPFQLQE